LFEFAVGISSKGTDFRTQFLPNSDAINMKRLKSLRWTVTVKQAEHIKLWVFKLWRLIKLDLGCLRCVISLVCSYPFSWFLTI